MFDRHLSATLPAEIQGIILEYAARADFRQARELIFLSRRVHAWIEPILYEKIDLDLSHHQSSLNERFLQAFDSKPASFLAKHVKKLRLVGDLEDEKLVVKILSTCTGVIDLVIAVIPPRSRQSKITLISHLNSHHPTRLSASPHLLFGLEPDFRHPLFQKLTHLDLNAPLERAKWSSLRLIPHLTHLCMWCPLEEFSDAFKCFAEFPKLEVFIWIPRYDISDAEQAQAEASTKPRVFFESISKYLLYYEEIGGISDSYDVFTRAESKVALRKLSASLSSGSPSSEEQQVASTDEANVAGPSTL